ncbi:MAG: OmpA family protein [Crocinitomicaceae bacterium]|nr:OmpA family protein [Crocinitomicaceae bacterium]
MKFLTFLGSILLSISLLAADFNPAGTWQGVMIRKGTKMKDASLIYVDFENNDGYVTGYSREEIYNSEFYSIKKINGDMTDGQLDLRQIAETKSNKSSRTTWCRVSASLNYDPVTGYLTGQYIATDCRNVVGDFILYRADFELSQDEEMESSQIWFEQFVKDYADGLSAPEIRKIERDNFVFEPIFFDYDKFDIREEHNPFLDAMIKIVKGHSDLRVKVTGHTDSDGSDQYNDTLSYNRAQAITTYFVKRGLDADRLEIDFKGERSPADTNNNPKGKQRNRRVDFEFI